MGNYYHKLALSFNQWQVVAIIGLAVIIVFGLSQYTMNRKLKIRKRYADRMLQLVALVDTVVLAVLLYRESYWGLIQLLDNTATKGAPIWSELLAPAMAIIIAGVLGVFTYVVGRVSAYIKLSGLKHIRRDVKRQRAKERRQRSGRRQFRDVRYDCPEDFQVGNLTRNRKKVG